MIYNSGWVWSTPRCHSIRIKILEKAKVLIKLLERIDYIIFAFHWYPALFSGSHGWFPPSTGRQQFRNLQVLTDFVLIISTWYISSQHSHFSQSVTPTLAFVFIKMIWVLCWNWELSPVTVWGGMKSTNWCTICKCLILGFQGRWKKSLSMSALLFVCAS